MIIMSSSNKPNHYFYALITSIHVYIGGSATVIQTKSPSYSITVPFMPVKTKLLLKDFDQQ